MLLYYFTFTHEERWERHTIAGTWEKSKYRRRQMENEHHFCLCHFKCFASLNIPLLWLWRDSSIRHSASSPPYAVLWMVRQQRSQAKREEEEKKTFLPTKVAYANNEITQHHLHFSSNTHPISYIMKTSFIFELYTFHHLSRCSWRQAAFPIRSPPRRAYPNKRLQDTDCSRIQRVSS